MENKAFVLAAFKTSPPHQLRVETPEREVAYDCIVVTNRLPSMLEGKKTLIEELLSLCWCRSCICLEGVLT